MDFSHIDVGDILMSFEKESMSDGEKDFVLKRAHEPTNSDLKEDGRIGDPTFVMSSESDDDKVPCLVCQDTHLPKLFETGMFGNRSAQDDLYYHLGHDEDRVAIAERKQKETSALWHMASCRMLEAISLTYDSEREASDLYESALVLKEDYDKRMLLYHETAKEFNEVVEDVEKLRQMKDMVFAENQELIASKNQIVDECNTLKQKNAVLEKDKEKLSQEVAYWKDLYHQSLSNVNDPKL